MYESLIQPLAKQDIREAAIWYNKRQNGLGKRFIDELRKKVVIIAVIHTSLNPELWETR